MLDKQSGAPSGLADAKMTTNKPAEAPSKGLVNQALLAELRPMVPKCQKALRQYQASGIVGDVEKTSYGAIFVEFDEQVWNDAIHKKKIDFALTAYCAHMPPDGKLTVTLQGLRTHDTLARVIDGNYWSGF
jgi:hypothetical protein